MGRSQLLVFSDNIQYEFAKPWTIDLESRSNHIATGAYTKGELINLGEGKIEIIQFDRNSRIKRMNMLAGITEMVFNLDELDNSKMGHLAILYLRFTDFL